MKIRFIYGVIPVIVIYGRLFLKKWMGGRSLYPLVIVDDTATGSDIIEEHEIIHAKQFVRTLGMQGILYPFSSKHRLKYELEAYQTYYDISHNKRAIANISRLLFNNYKLKMDYLYILGLATSYYTPTNPEKDTSIS